MEPGDSARLIGDPARVGLLTSSRRTLGTRDFVSVIFPNGPQWIPIDQLEKVEKEAEDVVDLLRRGRIAAPDDLYKALVHIQLAGRLANHIYSLDTTGTDFYAYQFKPVLKLLQSVSTGILVADEVGLGKTI